MRYLSVCSGIEAATVAWSPLGWSAAAFSEIEKFPRSVLAHHYPDVPLHGDFTTIKGDEYGPIELLVGGTPCQSFSVAGLRGGLADERGNLALEYLRLADRTRARWLVWENVPGVLSSNGGRDFGTFLGGLAELGYGFAYRVLDAQHFGVPQRRRRVFVVGYLGDWRRAAAVLFERHSLSGDSAPRREKGPSVAALTANGVGTCGADDNQGLAGHLIASTGATAHCLNAGGILEDNTQRVFPTLDTRMDQKFGCNQWVDSGQFVMETAHSLRGEGFDASEDGTGRGTPLVLVAAIQERAVSENPDAGPDGAGFRTDGQAYTLEARTVPQAIAFAQNQRDEVCEVPVVGALAAEPGMKQQTYIAFTAKDHGGDALSDCSPTLRAGGHSGSHANAGVMPAVAWSIMPQNSGKDFKARQVDVAQPLMAGGPVGGNQGGDYIQQSAVRRLTPRECERLQGFPEVQKCYTILLCRDYSDQQKSNALAALLCRKSPSNAWIADASGWTLSAEAAAHHSNTSLADPAPPVAVDVLIDLERQEVQLHSAGRSMSLAASAEGQSAFPLPTGIDSFARLAALTTHLWELTARAGKAASPASMTPSTTHQIGSGIAIPFGSGTEGRAADVATAIEMASRFSTFTTLPCGADTENLASTLTTLSCCVARAIAGFIPEQTAKAFCFVVRLTTSQGYTLIPYRGKSAADGPRYKALGNSMAVPVMAWIGERIAQVEVLASQAEAA